MSDALLKSMFDAAVKAALPEHCLKDHLPEPPKGRTVVIGAGKAAGSMAKAVEDHWQGPLDGIVVTRYDHKVETKHIEVIEASHPVPDDQGLQATIKIARQVQGLTEDDLVLCLISGGGSALLAMPGEGLTLDDKRWVNSALLKSGATITEMNCVRKHLSAIKGGRLAAFAYPARVVTLLISDVPGDDADVIASGPTVADPTTYQEARAIIDKYGIKLPDHIQKVLEDEADETPKPGDPRLANTEIRMIATPQKSLEAAANVARDAGITPLLLGDAIEGEAREVATVMAGMAKSVYLHGHPVKPPCVLLSGGETTVTVRGHGRGGRNAEFLLALAIQLEGQPHTYAIACDTDGIDGTEDNAGAILRPDSLARAEVSFMVPKALLADNNGYTFFQGLNDLLITGPTLTNVNDFRAILITDGQGA